MSKMFSIIVPIYKIREEYLRQCIESLIRQTFKDIEIHLMDDGSPDDCGRICDEYALYDSRVIVHHLNNGGQSAARNKGLNAAQGQYIIFVDGDDWIDINYCQKMHDLIVAHSNVDIIYTGYCYAFQNGNVNVTTVDSHFQKMVLLKDETKEKLLMAALYLPGYFMGDISKQAEYSVALWAKTFKKEYLSSHNLKCIEGISPFEDNIFCIEMLNSNPKLYFDSDILYFYRINEQSVTQRHLNHEYEIRNLSKTLKELKQIVNKPQLMALFAIMRIRQVTENIFLNAEICWKEKKVLLNNMRNDIEIAEQLLIIKKGQYYKKCHKNHRLFYELFYVKQWMLLRILFYIKKNSMTKRSIENDGLMRFK